MFADGGDANIENPVLLPQPLRDLLGLFMNAASDLGRYGPAASDTFGDKLCVGYCFWRNNVVGELHSLIVARNSGVSSRRAGLDKVPINEVDSRKEVHSQKGTLRLLLTKECLMPSPFPGMDPYTLKPIRSSRNCTPRCSPRCKRCCNRTAAKVYRRLERHLSEGSVWDAPRHHLPRAKGARCHHRNSLI